ncbi:FmdB family zinc ribbon protein [Pseudomonadota bacterium]
MPIYEYSCNACGHNLEALQKFSDEPLKFCPECNEPTLKKLISAAAFHLKGTGWYETDFKNNGKKAESDKGKTTKSKTKPESGDTKSSDSKSTDAKGDTSKKTSDSASTSSESSSSNVSS